MSVYTKMLEVQQAMAKAGIEKGQKNQHGNYYFRGIDDVQNALAPVLADVGLLVIPSVIHRSFSKSETTGGKATNRWVVDVRYQFVDPDGKEGDHISAVTEFSGEAYDTSDKGLQKAITSAYKYMLFEVFCIPVAGTADADEEHHEVKAAEPLTEYQLKEILGLCMKTNTDVDQFVAWLGYESLNKTPGSEYPRALSALQAKERKMAKEYAEGEREIEEIPDGQ